jgi:hypothetical protein
MQAAPERHAQRENVDDEQVEDATDHHQRCVVFLGMVDHQRQICPPRQRRVAARDCNDHCTLCSGLLRGLDQIGSGATRADEHGRIAAPQHRGGRTQQTRIGVHPTGHPQPQELDVSVLRHHAVVAECEELDPRCFEQPGQRLLQGLLAQALAHLPDRGGGVVQHLGAQVQHRVIVVHLAVRHGHGAGQSGGQPQLEVRKTFAAQRATEADHGRLAHIGQTGDLGDRLVEHLPRHLEDTIGHAPLGLGQRIAGAPDSVQHTRPRPDPAQLHLEDLRRTAQCRVLVGDDKGGDARDVGTKAPFGLEAGTKARAVETLAQPLHDLAADVDAPEGAERHCQVGRHRTEHAAEGIDHLHAQRIFALQRQPQDLRRIRRLGGGCARTSVARQSLVDQLQPAARQQALEGNVRKTTPHMGEDAVFPLIAGGKGTVPSLGTQ